MTLGQALMLREERLYVNPLWTLIAWVAGFISNGKAQIIPPRPVREKRADKPAEVVPEFARELIRRGWTPPHPAP